MELPSPLGEGQTIPTRNQDHQGEVKVPAERGYYCICLCFHLILPIQIVRMAKKIPAPKLE